MGGMGPGTPGLVRGCCAESPQAGGRGRQGGKSDKIRAGDSFPGVPVFPGWFLLRLPFRVLLSKFWGVSIEKERDAFLKGRTLVIQYSDATTMT